MCSHYKTLVITQIQPKYELDIKIIINFFRKLFA